MEEEAQEAAVPALQESEGQAMNTKRWLLDLIDADEKLTRERFAKSQRDRDPAERAHAASYYNVRLLTIERARQLVEKGPDEP
jgi:hypothetical protein